MPIYDYKCNLCNHSFEKLVKNDNEEIICPKCKSAEVTKQLSAPVGLTMGGDSSCPPNNSPFK